jgi:hypothetical protein
MLCRSALRRTESAVADRGLPSYQRRTENLAVALVPCGFITMDTHVAIVAVLEGVVPDSPEILQPAAAQFGRGLFQRLASHDLGSRCRAGRKFCYRRPAPDRHWFSRGSVCRSSESQSLVLGKDDREVVIILFAETGDGDSLAAASPAARPRAPPDPVGSPHSGVKRKARPGAREEYPLLQISGPPPTASAWLPVRSGLLACWLVCPVCSRRRLRRPGGHQSPWMVWLS